LQSRTPWSWISLIVPGLRLRNCRNAIDVSLIVEIDIDNETWCGWDLRPPNSVHEKWVLSAFDHQQVGTLRRIAQNPASLRHDFLLKSAKTPFARWSLALTSHCVEKVQKTSYREKIFVSLNKVVVWHLYGW